MKKLRICQVNPGLLPIPRNGWGAIEAVIYNYHKELTKLGHVCDIKYLDEINPSDYDIIHNHTGVMASPDFKSPVPFSTIAQKRNIKYIYSMHDHHAVVSDIVFNDNRETIKHSIKTIVHDTTTIANLYAEFEPTYISHGVDVNFFRPNSTPTNFSILCVANNGLSKNPGSDRKGFLIALKIAEKLDVPITFVGPSNNKNFFAEHQSELTYTKINYLYDLTDAELAEEYTKHSVFLHLSNLEAGSPNLTLLEAMSCGLPVVGVYEGPQLDGLHVITPQNRDNVDFIANVVKKFTNSIYWTKISSLSRETAEKNSWEIVAKKLESFYQSTLNNEQMKASLITTYTNIPRIFTNNKIRISFIDGAKVEINGNNKENYDVKFINTKNNEVMYTSQLSENMWASPSLKYFVDWKILVNDKEFRLDLKNKKVLISLDSSALGDTLAWIPYAHEFQKKHSCKLTVTTFWNELFENVYPDLNFKEPGQNLDDYYAYYRIGCWDNDFSRNKEKWNTIPLQKVACDILGLDYVEIKPLVYCPNTTKTNDYIAITTTATAKAKLWNANGGWQQLIDSIKNEYNLNTVVLQKEKSTLKRAILHTDMNIFDTITDLKNAKLFVGLGSGLSWLAWALNVPTILISGFSDDFVEFNTPYRISPNIGVCHGCYNDPNIIFDRADWNWCPRQKNFECTTTITVNDVMNQIKKIINE